MKSYIFILVFTILIINASAQSITLKTGYLNRHLLDEQKSALAYTSHEFSVGIYFQNISAKSLFETSLSFNRGRFMASQFRNRWLYTSHYDIEGNEEKDSTLLQSQLIGGEFQVSYLRNLTPLRRSAWYAGVRLRDFILNSDNNTGLLNSAGLYASIYNKTHVGKLYSVSFDFSIPLFSVNTRLPWHNTSTSPEDSEFKTFFKKGTKISGPDKFMAISSNLQFEMKLTPKISTGACYTFSWFHLSYYQHMNSFYNAFQVLMTYKF